MLELTADEMAIARKVLEAAAAWFSQNDPEAEQFFPSFKLQEMAHGKLDVLSVVKPVVVQ